MKSTFLISIIIPTRNRQKYAFAAVSQILSLRKNIQIVVQDNSDDNSLKEMLKDVIDNDTVIYNYVPYRIAGIDNYNSAASYAKGDYFCAIGDDDAVLPSIIDIALWMKKNDIDAVMPKKTLTYFWPDVNNPNKNKKIGKLRLYGINDKVCVHNSQRSVIELLKNGGQGYLNLPMAVSYHGLVKTKRMQEVNHITGRYYGGLSPDIYSAVCLSLLKDMKLVEIGYPISLPGICPQSTSAASDKGMHIGKLDTAPHFVGLKEPYVWDNLVPEYYSVETIWAETMLKAVKAMGREDLIVEYFNSGALINSLINNNPDSKDEIFEHLNSEQKSTYIAVDTEIRQSKINKLKKLIWALFGRITGKILAVNGCGDIREAADKVSVYLSKPGCSKKLKTILNVRI